MPPRPGIMHFDGQTVPAYTASKAAVSQLTRELSNDINAELVDTADLSCRNRRLTESLWGPEAAQ